MKQMEPAQILQFPQPQRQVSTAVITELINGLPSQCRLLHIKKTLNIVAVLDMPHPWQVNETINVLHNNKKAIVIGCTSTPDKRFNLTVKLNNTTTNLISNEDATGKPATQCQFLCGASKIVIPNTTESLIDFETFDNNSLWCLLLLGFTIYAN